MSNFKKFSGFDDFETEIVDNNDGVVTNFNQISIIQEEEKSKDVDELLKNIKIKDIEKNLPSPQVRPNDSGLINMNYLESIIEKIVIKMINKHKNNE